MTTPRLAALVLLGSALSLGACGGSPDAEQTSTSDDALRACAGGHTLKGLDVSHFNGPVDWNAVKRSGHAFGVAAIGDGTYEDPSFATNWAGMKRAGLIRGAYQFFRTRDDAAVLAAIVVRKVGRLGAGDLPVTLDLEGQSIEGEPRATVMARAREWLAIVEQGTGKRPIIYTGKYVWDDSVGDTHLGRHPLWIAAYQSSCPLIPGGWADFAFWQYSDRGHVPGAGTGDVDIFNGTLADLERLAGEPGPAAPAGPDRSCHSATLGKTVPDNTCVQSRSDSRWYQCQDGGWVDRAPDPERCASVHPL